MKRTPRRRLRLEQLEKRELLASIDLSLLTSSGGTTIFGAASQDQAGISVDKAGDVNGDGFEDWILGAFLADGVLDSVSAAGDAYLIFGRETLPTSLDLNALGGAGVVLHGVDADDALGWSVSQAGDVNGDGFDDVLLGARRADGSGNSKLDTGETYLLFGQPSFPASIALSTLGSKGVVFYGVDQLDQSGHSVSGAGDVNGDGFDDFLIGAPYADTAGRADAGETYLVFGKAVWPTTVELGGLGSEGVLLQGAKNVDQSGRKVRSAGDVNGDGLGDFIIGALLAGGTSLPRPLAGESYLVFGSLSFPATIDLASLGSRGITILGADASDFAVSVGSAGDFNGDGVGDWIIGGMLADGEGNFRSASGEAYLLFGGSSLPGTIDLAAIAGLGIRIVGADEGDRLGVAVNAAGDLNGDGLDDLLLGAYQADSVANGRANAGESYILFGTSSPPSLVDLRTLAANGVVLYGIDPADLSGRSVGGAGDTNGDGFDDIIIGANEADAASNALSNAGEAYVVLGGNSFTSSVTHLGSGVSETLTGTANADVMVGGQGNDTLIGNGGGDVMIGGEGDDLLRVADIGFQRLRGGRGNDTLRWEATDSNLDLTTLSDLRLHGVETIDLRGAGNNILRVNAREVLNLSVESNDLLVRRDATDTVDFGSGWTKDNYEVLGGVLYEVYEQGEARLKIEANISGPTVLNRQVFYNRSPNPVFGDGSGNPLTAIDPSKTPLFLTQTSSFQNMTNYVKGLNGLIVDFANLPNPLVAADFLFSVWDGINEIMPLTVTPTITNLTGGGMDGSTRIKIDFPDFSVRNLWLATTILANTNTGLVANETFYFGNAVGDFDVGNIGSPVVVRVDAADVAAVRQHQSPAIQSVGIGNIYDINKDGRVNATDTALVRQNLGSQIIRHFTAPMPTSSVMASSAIETDLGMASVDSLAEDAGRFCRDPGSPLTNTHGALSIDVDTVQPRKRALASAKYSITSREAAVDQVWAAVDLPNSVLF